MKDELKIRLKNLEISKQDLISYYDNKIPIYLVNIRNLNNNKKYIFKLISIKSENIAVRNITHINVRANDWNTSIDINTHTGFVSFIHMLVEFSNYEIKQIVAENHLVAYAAQVGPIDLIDTKTSPFYKKYTIDTETSTIDFNKKGEKMMNTKINNVVDNNSVAAKLAAQVTAGKALNNTVMDKAKGNLPMMLRGYSDHPLASVVLANIVSFSVDNFVQGNTKARWAADAMLVAAMTEFMSTFNIEDILQDVLAASAISVPGDID